MILFTVALLAVADCVLAACTDGWLHHGDFCYFFSTDRLNWTSARDACLGMDGYLAEPKTKIESEYLEAVARTRHSRGIWLGGTDQDKEGQWVWAHSNELFTETFTDWTPMNPNNNHIENCLDLNRHLNMQWNDTECDRLLNYICEQRLSENALVPVLPNNFG